MFEVHLFSYISLMILCVTI